MVSTTYILAILCVTLYALRKYLDFKKSQANVSYWPGNVNIIGSFTLLGLFLPRIKGIHRGREHIIRSKHEDFRRVGWNIISNTSIFPPSSVFSVADADAIREITLSRARFPKPVERYGLLAFFGSNIVVTEGEEWKRHRRISAPAFSDKNNRLVWDATVSVMEELFSDIWGEKSEVVSEQFLDLTTRIALMVLSIAGYGRHMLWKDDAVIPKRHRMTFTDALTTVSQSLPLKILLPTWMMGLTKRTRKIRTAFEETSMYLTEMIEERRLLVDKEDRWDLLTNLMSASEDDNTAEAMLTHSELTGNIFIYLVAGHESTAHAVCYVFGLLALYQDEQEKLYQHIRSVVGDRKPVYGDYMSLNRVLACFYEALRLYPVVVVFPKRSAEDTVISATSADPANESTAKIVVPKGTALNFNIPALHYNPKYWEDPYEFKPERFLGNWNRDAFMAFSSGARACIGRRFSESEAVAVITMLITRYKVTVKDDPMFPNETVDAKRARILDSSSNLTLTPKKVPLVFTRR